MYRLSSRSGECPPAHSAARSGASARPEIPHGTAIEVTRFFERDDGIIDLEVAIFCEKDSHKGIIIGKKGAMLKKIGELARKDIEEFMGTKVYLQTWVKVKENWRDNAGLLHDYGYDLKKDD